MPSALCSLTTPGFFGIGFLYRFFFIFKIKIMWISLARLCLKNCFKKYILKIQFVLKKNYFLPVQKQQVFGTETHKIIPNSCLVSVSLSFLNTMLFVSIFVLVWHAHLYALGVLTNPSPTILGPIWAVTYKACVL